ncbi:MAG: transglutaminase domain-containing protein [Planctomycetes bacterium]|nr:transglutaminase domain-containing protein [Planctomycetota bacterium]
MRNQRIRLLISFFLIPCGLALAAPLDPKNPPMGRFSDDWAELYMSGGKVGYAHTTMTREGDSIVCASKFSMTLGRVDSPVKIEMTQSTTESLEGAPITFGNEMNASIMKTVMRGDFKDGKVNIVNSQYGMEQTQTFDYPRGAVMTWGSLRENLIRGLKPGTKYTLQTYAPELRYDAAIPAAYEIGNWEKLPEKVAKASGAGRGQKVTVKMEAPMGSLEMVSWVDADGDPLFSKLPMPGLGDLEVVRSTQAAAMADFVAPEFFMKSTIKSPRKLDRAKIESITYRLKAAGDALNDLPETDMQHVVKKGDGFVDLLVTRQKHSKEPQASAHATPLSSEQLAEFIEPNLMINTKDPKLIELAKEAGKGEKDPYKLADNLRRFVTDYVENKSLNIGFATASEVARTKEGDCSEHGVLLAALARLNGLPSRVAVGIAYVPFFGNADDIFGYHMWTEVYIDGKWIDIDAALRETDCSPARIAFAVSSLRNAGVADISFPLMSKLGAVELEILEVKPRD